ncbi:LIC_10190 family membrane protein [Kaistella pullorum]|nr:hypothetical protein [Kaistella pullorum]
MLYLLISLLILLPVFSGFGAAVNRYIHTTVTGVAANVLTGMLGLTVTFTLLAFFIPLSVWVEVFTVIIGFSLFLYLKVYRDIILFFKVQNFWFYLFSVLILFAGSGFPFILDHFGYYVPTSKWLAEVGLVRGIANLDLVLGQMSFWHILQAGFSRFTDPFMRLNSIMAMAYLMYVFEKKAWSHLILFPVLLLFVQSPSPDLPAVVLSLVVLNEILSKNKSHGWLFTVSVFAFAIKPTLIWLPVFSLLYIVSDSRRNFKTFFGGAAIGLLFIVKNCWTFGFPVFPVQAFDFGFSWKPHPDILQISSETAYRKTFDMQFSVAEIKGFTLTQLMAEWLSLPFPKGLINILFILGLLIFLLFCVLQKQKVYWLLFLSIIIKTVLVLAFSAQYRFFLEVFFVLAVVFFYKKANNSQVFIFSTALSLIILLMISFPKTLQKTLPNFRSGTFMTGLSVKQLIKPATFKLERFQTHQIGNLKFNIVEAYFYSFDTPLPAITPYAIKKYDEAGIFPQLKGKTLSEGFVWKKLSKTDQRKLKQIIQKMNLEKYGR